MSEKLVTIQSASTRRKDGVTVELAPDIFECLHWVSRAVRIDDTRTIWRNIHVEAGKQTVVVGTNGRIMRVWKTDKLDTNFTKTRNHFVKKVLSNKIILDINRNNNDPRGFPNWRPILPDKHRARKKLTSLRFPSTAAKWGRTDTFAAAEVVIDYATRHGKNRILNIDLITDLKLKRLNPTFEVTFDKENPEHIIMFTTELPYGLGTLMALLMPGLSV